MAWLAVPLAIATAVSTMFGGVVAFRLRKELATVIAFTGGIVVAVALFDVLPEALDLIDSPRRVTAVVGAGFVAFFLVERVLVLHHRDEPEQARAHARVGAFGAAGLSLHSFLDGLGIGLALHVSTATGLLVFLAVISHDFADGMNTVSFVLRQSGDVRSALRWLAIDAAAPLVGAIVGASLTISDTPSAMCSRPMPASSSSSARPTCSPRRTATRRGVASCSRSPVLPRRSSSRMSRRARNERRASRAPSWRRRCA